MSPSWYKRAACLLILILGSLRFLVHGYRESVSSNYHARDFKPVYSGALCLLHHCNPYDEDQIKDQFVLSGGDLRDPIPFIKHNANYAPPALFVVTPVALLPWHIADPLWLLLSASLLVVSAFLTFDLCRPFSPLLSSLCIDLLLAGSMIMMVVLQPACMAIALCVIAVWCLLKRRYSVLATVCFALSLAIKPQIGGLVWLYFLLAEPLYRKRAIQIFLASLALYIPAMLWVSLTPASAHWVRDLHANLAGIAARGNFSDPGPTNPDANVFTNLQALFSLFRDDPAVYNKAAWGIVGVLFLVWMYLVLRMQPSIRKDYLALASIACLSLLPVYHRAYDARLLMLIFPAVALLLAEAKIAGKLALVLSLIAVWLTSTGQQHFPKVWWLSPNAELGLLATIAVQRHIPVVLLGLSVLFLVCMWEAARRNGMEERISAELAAAT